MSKTGVYQEGSKFVTYIDGVVKRKSKHKAHAAKALIEAGILDQSTSSVEVSMPEPSRFNINERFEFLDSAVKMVAKGLQASAVISGSGGLGKSYSVKKALLACGFKDLSVMNLEEGAKINRAKSFVIVKGYSTPKGLYRTLFENNDGVIVFDDCDSVLKDPVAQNLLKGALDSYDTRIISWNADMRDEDLPRSFIFTGRVIFVSNMVEEKIDQAIRSRSAVIDVTMTLEEIIERMKVIVASETFLPEFDAKIKQEALEFVDQFKAKVKNLTLRTLITVCKVRADGSKNWKDMAEYLICK